MLYTIIYIILTAVVLTFIFHIILKNPGPWDSFWAFLGILFLFMFASYLWLTPSGPMWYGIAWLDTLLIGLLIALLLGAAGESRQRDFYRTDKGEVDLVAEAKAEKGAVMLFGVFFWLFLIVMSLIIVIGLLHTFHVI